MSTWTDKKSVKNGRAREPRLSDLVEMHKWSSGAFVQARAVGPMLAVRRHWIRYKTKEGKVINIGKRCATPHGKEDDPKFKCGLCEHLGDRPRVSLLQNMIVRSLQDQEPKKRGRPTDSEKKLSRLPWSDDAKVRAYVKSGKTSEIWTPVRVFELSSSVTDKIFDISALNRVTSKKTGKTFTYGPEHPKFGFDLTLKRDDDASPANMYFVQKDGRTPLTEEEEGYHIWRLDAEAIPSYEDTLKEAKFLGRGYMKRNKDGKDVEAFIRSEDARDGNEGAGGKGNGLDDYSELTGDDEQQDEGERVKKKKKKASGSRDADGGKKGSKLKKKRRDEEPRVKTKGKVKAKVKSKGKRRSGDRDSYIPFR